MCALAAVFDHRRRIIPNALTLPVLFTVPLIHGWFGGEWSLVSSVFAALVCFAPAYFLFRRSALGGGDVKMFAALGATLGLHAGLELQLTAFVLLTVFVLAARAVHGGFFTLLRRSFAAALSMLAPSTFRAPRHDEDALELPMGGAIFLACCAVAVRGIA